MNTETEISALKAINEYAMMIYQITRADISDLRFLFIKHPQIPPYKAQPTKTKQSSSLQEDR